VRPVTWRLSEDSELAEPDAQGRARDTIDNLEAQQDGAEVSDVGGLSIQPYCAKGLPGGRSQPGGGRRRSPAPGPRRGAAGPARLVTDRHRPSTQRGFAPNRSAGIDSPSPTSRRLGT
jgi:hypothetical protein